MTETTLIPWLQRTFEIRERGSSVRTELLAGLTTYMAMSYILLVNPAILSVTGMDQGAVLVGVFMMASVGDIEWSEPHHAIPAFLTVIMMPLTTSITEGIAFGFISTSVLYLASGRGRELHWAVHLISVFFLAHFIWS